MYPIEGKDKGRVGGSTVLVQQLTGVARHLLQLLTSTLTQTSFIAECTNPGELEGGAGVERVGRGEGGGGRGERGEREKLEGEGEELRVKSALLCLINPRCACTQRGL